MKIVKEENAEKFNYADISSVLEYGIALNEKNMDFCTNKISGRYPMETNYMNVNSFSQKRQRIKIPQCKTDGIYPVSYTHLTLPTT